MHAVYKLSLPFKAGTSISRILVRYHGPTLKDIVGCCCFTYRKAVSRNVLMLVLARDFQPQKSTSKLQSPTCAAKSKQCET